MRRTGATDELPAEPAVVTAQHETEGGPTQKAIVGLVVAHPTWVGARNEDRTQVYTLVAGRCVGAGAGCRRAEFVLERLELRGHGLACVAKRSFNALRAEEVSAESNVSVVRASLRESAD
jgi:hypothetical protein